MTKAGTKAPLEQSQELHALAIQPYSGNQTAVLACCTAVIDESLAKALASAGMQAGQRLSLRDLMTEAEHILHKTLGGLSLFKWLQHDQSLRDSLMDIIGDMLEEHNAGSRQDDASEDMVAPQGCSTVIH